MKLTAEQAQVVTENHNLIYWYINKNNLDIEEYYDLLAIELCHTVMKYDPSKGSLGNYFKLRADGVVYKEYRKTQTQKRLHTRVSLVDNLHSITDTEDIFNLLDFEEWMEGEYGEVLKLKAEGYNQTEIADKLGVSQSYISKILKKLRKEYLERNEI